METLSDLPAVPELAVIINVDTKYVSTLALLGALRHLNISTLMIDCESADGSFEWFRSLQDKYAFHLMSAPRRPHGTALDWIFQNARSDSILLIDSDIEIMNGQMFEEMRGRLRQDDTYGSGYLQQGGWLQTHYGTDQTLASGIGFYQTRPWIPFAMFRVAPVCKALASGASFKHALVFNDVPQLPKLSRLLWRRFRFAVFRHLRLRCFDGLRRKYEGWKPAYVFCDTGAEIHGVLAKAGWSFADVGAAIPYWSIRHLQGVTRDLLQGPSSDAQAAGSIESVIREKLQNEYGLNIS